MYYIFIHAMRAVVSADRPRHVDFSVKDWVRGGVYV